MTNTVHVPGIRVPGIYRDKATTMNYGTMIIIIRYLTVAPTTCSRPSSKVFHTKEKEKDKDKRERNKRTKERKEKGYHTKTTEQTNAKARNNRKISR